MARTRGSGPPPTAGAEKPAPLRPPPPPRRLTTADPSVLWQDGERVLRRQSRLGPDGAPRIVLVVAPAAEHPTSTTLERLSHEWGLKEELDGAWAVRPLELEREHGRMALVLEDPGGEPLARVVGAPMEMDTFLRL